MTPLTRICAAVASLVASIVAMDSHSMAQDITAEQVNRAIDSGVKFLLNEQNPRTGAWSIGEKSTVVRGGSTSLCTLALLNCGVSRDNPRIKKAIEYLQAITPESVYVVSLRIMIYCEANPAKYQNLIRADVNWLVNRQSQHKRHTGGWSYGAPGETADASNSQYALLALHEAQQAGIAIDPVVWELAKTYWAKTVHPGNGGGYYKSGLQRGPSGAMTCAAISSLIIIEENLARPEDQLVGGKVQCCGGGERPKLVTLALEWLGKNFSVASNPMPNGTGSLAKFYYLYGMERAGRMAGQRFFHGNDWYRLGASQLVRIQRNGAWRGSAAFAEDAKIVATSFALLFLAKGRRPVVIGQYKHSDPTDWKLHPKGVHYLTRSIEKAWSQKLNWQTVDGESAGVDDLLETPVLFVSGKSALDLNKKQKNTLRQYVENGGFIFAEACQGDGCGADSVFDKKFRALVAELFPNSKLTTLDPAHPIWQAHHKVMLSEERPLLGLQASCRTSIVYCPANLSCFWQLNQPAWAGKFPDAVQREIDYCTRLGTNVVAYATGRELKDKLDRPRIAAAGDGGMATRSLEIPKLTHGGGSDDAPNAWRNILNRLRFDMQGMRINLKRKFVEAKIEQLQQFPIVFMHGRSKFKFNEKQRQAIRKYIEQGGFLFADTICSARPFADSFRKEMKAIFPESPMRQVAKESSVWNLQYGYDVRTVILRSPAKDNRGVAAYNERETYPIMESVTLANGRLAVLFSPYDLSCALENSGMSECSGYRKEDAERIGVNVILFALQQPESDPNLEVSGQ